MGMDMQQTRTVNVGVIGLGTVGGGVVKLIERNHDIYLTQRGIDVRVVKACARHEKRADELKLAAGVFTADWRDITSDPEIDIVVEVIGGEHPALDIMLDAFAHGKHVVSANKALLARHMEQIAHAAHKAGVALRCEAAVAGGIPIVDTLERDLSGNRILAVAGIMNGTTNYILSRMASEGLGYETVLADAQRLGYAEADPTADVDGLDAAAKIAILASIAFGTRVTADDVHTEGIRTIGADDICMARELGCTIKLIAVARQSAEGVNAHVYPALIDNSHMLTKVSGAMNAVVVVGDGVGETMFYGAGAGAFPTASAVVGDILALAEPLSRGLAPLAEAEPFKAVRAIVPQKAMASSFVVRLEVSDAQALDAARGALFDRGIHIARTVNLSSGETSLLTKAAVEADALAACDALRELPGVVRVSRAIRIEDVASWSHGVRDN